MVNSVDASFAESFLLIVLIPFVMGTKLNKKNEKRKNINRIIVGTRYKNKKKPLPLAPPPQGEE